VPARVADLDRARDEPRDVAALGLPVGLQHRDAGDQVLLHEVALLLANLSRSSAYAACQSITSTEDAADDVLERLVGAGRGCTLKRGEGSSIVASIPSQVFST
jgi:hypothetical protein